MRSAGEYVRQAERELDAAVSAVDNERYSREQTDRLVAFHHERASVLAGLANAAALDELCGGTPAEKVEVAP